MKTEFIERPLVIFIAVILLGAAVFYFELEKSDLYKEKQSQINDTTKFNLNNKNLFNSSRTTGKEADNASNANIAIE